MLAAFDLLGLNVDGDLCQIATMDRAEILTILRAHEAELKAAGIVHLHLHGSFVRTSEVRSLPDVDLIAEFDPQKHFTLLDMVDLENRLHDLLGIAVDLSPAHTLKRAVREKAASEAVLAF
jgi:uncharacterized protein